MSWLDRLLRRGGSAEPQRPEAPEALTERLTVELLHTDGWRLATVEVRSSRVSDALNDAGRELVASALDGSPLDLDDALLVIPPVERAGEPARKLHRPTHPLWVRIGDWSVTGSLHLPPGTVGTAFLLRRNLRYFPLTDATLWRALPGGREERRVPVLLVNLLQVSSLRDTPEPEPAPTSVEVPPL